MLHKLLGREKSSGIRCVPLRLEEARSWANREDMQSDTARLLRTVVNSLYQDQDVWVRELCAAFLSPSTPFLPPFLPLTYPPIPPSVSNSNDALEKTRLLSLTDSSLLSTAPDLNITILADVPGNRIVIRDSGIGMSKDALVTNLGTLAKSGTSEFLGKLEKGDGGNLIGQVSREG